MQDKCLYKIEVVMGPRVKYSDPAGRVKLTAETQMEETLWSKAALCGFGRHWPHLLRNILASM